MADLMAPAGEFAGGEISDPSSPPMPEVATLIEPSPRWGGAGGSFTLPGDEVKPATMADLVTAPADEGAEYWASAGSMDPAGDAHLVSMARRYRKHLHDPEVIKASKTEKGLAEGIGHGLAHGATDLGRKAAGVVGRANVIPDVYSTNANAIAPDDWERMRPDQRTRLLRLKRQGLPGFQTAKMLLAPGFAVQETGKALIARPAEKVLMSVLEDNPHWTPYQVEKASEYLTDPKKLVHAAAEMLPFSGGAIAATLATAEIGGAGGFLFSSAIEGQGATEEALIYFMDENEGKPITAEQVQQAKTIGNVYGPIAGAIEVAQIGHVLKLARGGKRAVLRLGLRKAFKAGAGKFTKDSLKVAFAEAIEEMLQQVAQDLTGKGVADIPVLKKGQDVYDYLDDLAKQGIPAAFSAIATGSAGRVANAARSVKQENRQAIGEIVQEAEKGRQELRGENTQNAQQGEDQGSEQGVLGEMLATMGDKELAGLAAKIQGNPAVVAEMAKRLGERQQAQGIRAQNPQEQPEQPPGAKISENPTPTTAGGEISRALAAGETDAGTAKLARYLVTEVDPSFDENSALEISGVVKAASADIIKAEGLQTTDPDTGEAINYEITGSTTSDLEASATRTAVQLYRGHDPDTLVEEWYHRFWDRLPRARQRLYETYHRQTGDSRDVAEHFGQEGRDYFFSAKLHSNAGAIRELFQNARASLRALIRRMRGVRGAQIPEKIQQMYGAAGGQMIADPGQEALGQYPAGKETTVQRVGGQGDRATYKIVEAGDLIASHDPMNFAPRTEYPAGVQERQYHRDQSEQDKVIEIARNFDPAFVINDNPDAINGPPVVTAAGIVLGGNSRAMAISRIYEENIKAAEKYRQTLAAKSGQFGFTPIAVNSYDRPVLVRVLNETPADTADLAAAGRAYNQSFTQGMGTAAEAVSRAKLLTPMTIETVGNLIAASEAGSIRGLLKKPADSQKILHELLADGAITEREVNRYIDPRTQVLNDEGKSLIEKIILGTVIDDADLLANMPTGIRGKIGRALAPLAAIKALGGDWDIAADLKVAVAGMIRWDRNRQPTVEDYLGQGELFSEDADPIKSNSKAQALLRMLDGTPIAAVKAALENYAAEGRRAAESKKQSSFDFAEEPLTAAEAFEKYIAATAGQAVEHFQLRPVATEGPVFYSKLTEIVEAKMPPRIPAAQLAALLKKNGVKDAELIWSGVDELIAGGGKVEKDKVLETIKANDPVIVEVVKGKWVGEINRQDRDYQLEIRSAALGLIEHDAAAGNWQLDGPDDKVQETYLDRGDMASRNAMDRLLATTTTRATMVDYEREAEETLRDEFMGDGPKDTKFDTYTLPGGENYTELLLTLPTRPGPMREAIVDRNGAFVDWADENDLSKVGREREARAGNTIEQREDSLRGSDDYRSGHWDEDNVLAHVRFNDRIDAAGEKVLFIEEIQSDWHQAGRQRGYALPAARRAELDARRVELEGLGYEASSEQKQEWADIMTELQPEKVDRQVPNAPFKKTWHELALKRMLRWAAENGYDKLAWTTGEMQAERYDLSKQVEKIGWARRDDNTHDLTVYVRGSEENISRDAQSDAQLEALIGKEAAKKIIEAEPGAPKISGYQGVGDLLGDDLKVGGEGMKGFYDRMIPSFLGKYIKKWGGKISEMELTTEKDIGENITVKLLEKAADLARDEKDSVAVKFLRDEANAIRDGEGYSGVLVNPNPFPGATRPPSHYLQEARKFRDLIVTVPSIEITEQMTESVMAGQPHFQVRPPGDGEKDNRDYLEKWMAANEAKGHTPTWTEYMDARIKSVEEARKIVKGPETGKSETQLPGSEELGAPDGQVDKALLAAMERLNDEGDKAGLLARTYHRVARALLIAVEPAKLTEKVSPAVYVEIMKMAHSPEALGIRWDFEKVADLGDISFGEFHRQLEKLSDRQIADIYLWRGKPFSVEGKRLAREAGGRMTPELKKYARALQIVYDTNYAIMTSLDIDAVYYNDYFYGAFVNDAKAAKFWKNWKTTTGFTKEKKMPTVADALAYGLKLKHRNPIDNARAELMGIARLAAMRKLKAQLLENSYGTAVIKVTEAEAAGVAGWETIEEPQLNGLLFHPDVARLINNMIAVNKTSRGWLRVFRNFTHTLNGIKFLVPFFHLRTIIAQGVVDTGLGGFLMPWRWKLGSRFKTMDPVFKSPAYLEYIGLGGGHSYSVESASRKALNKLLTDPAYHWTWRGIRAPLRYTTAAQRGINTFVFEKYIPAMKFAKYLQQIQWAEKKSGGKLSEAQKIKIIKEGQNFYGEMNEKLFGRSATMTSALRFFFLAPGFREGNYRTMYKALTIAFDKQAGPTGRAWRSALNIPQFLLFTATIASIGTLIMTGEVPELPEDEDEFRDMFKIKTQWKDWKGRPIYIDLMTSDKDYFEQLVKPAWQLASGKPLQAAESSMNTFIKTIGGMRSTVSNIAGDLQRLSSGEVLVDWKGGRVFYVTDPALIKLKKVMEHLWGRAEPIPWSTTRRMLDKNVGAMAAFISGAVGIRVSMSERDKKRAELWRQFYSKRDERDELAKVIRQERVTQGQINDYNRTIETIQKHPLIEPELREYLDRLKLKDLGYYRASKLIRRRDEALDVAVGHLNKRRPDLAKIHLDQFNRRHPGARVTMAAAVSRRRRQIKNSQLNQQQKDLRRIPRDIRGAIEITR